MSILKYKIQESCQRVHDFDHPDASVFNTRVEFTFIIDNPLYSPEDEDEFRYVDIPTYFTYYAREPCIPSVDDALVFLRNEIRTVLGIHKKGYGVDASNYSVKNSITSELYDVSLTETADYIRHLSPGIICIPLDDMKVIDKHQYLLYSVYKYISSLFYVWEGHIFETDNEFIEWLDCSGLLRDR